MKLEHYQALQAAVARAKEDHQRALGAREHLLSQLHSRFGCRSLAEAQAELTKRERRAAKAKAAFQQALSDFKAKWKHVLPVEQ